MPRSSPLAALSALADRLEPRPRLVDWSILALVMVGVGTGVLALLTGQPRGRVVFWLHGIAGLALALFLVFKFRRVSRRVTNRTHWDRATPISILVAIVAVLALATGIFWVLGGDFRFFVWNALTVHMFLGVLVLPLVLLHLRHRFRLPRRTDFEARRTTLQFTGLLLTSAVAWRLQGVANRLLNTAGATRRFTGSKPAGSEGDADFPVTNWMVDDPDRIDTDDWELSVDGAVSQPLALDYTDLGTPTNLRATLDCTSGWYTVQDWRGVRVGDLLERAGTGEDAQWVRFRSVTGYRWSLPIEEARDALLATHVGENPLSHGHGAPLRLVAPGRRGFQWVKWVETVEVRKYPDFGQWVAIFVSGFE